MDVLELLKKDHAEVTRLFQRFESGGGRSRRGVVQKICEELQVHSKVEEEIFYPAVRERGDQEMRGQIDEALKEHGRVKQQVAMLQGMRHDEGDDGEMESAVSTLQQDVEHHVTEEEGEMFPRVRELMDEDALAELGRRIRDRKRTLTGERPASARRRRTTTSRKRTASARRGRAKTTRGRAKTRTSTKRKTGARSRKRARG